MKVKFRQGVIRPYYSELTPGDPSIPTYLNKVGNDVAIRASYKDPIIVNFCHKTKNYLYQEFDDKIAWKNIQGVGPHWLFWEISEDGTIQYGSTKLEPLVGNTFPENPSTDQHFFNVSGRAVFVWTSARRWEEKIRVFATKYENQEFPEITFAFAENRSQVGLNQEVSAGYLVFGESNKVVKDGDSFVTTEDNLLAQGDFFNRNKVATHRVDGLALQNIAKYECVTWSGPQRKISRASSLDVNNPAIGVMIEGVSRHQVRQFITKGYIHDPTRFNWNEPANTYLFLGVDGSLTTKPPLRASIQRMGYIVDRRTIYIDVGRQVLIDPTFIPAPEIPFCVDITCPVEYCVDITCPVEYCVDITCPVEYCADITCPIEYCVPVICPEPAVSDLEDYIMTGREPETIIVYREVEENSPLELRTVAEYDVRNYYNSNEFPYFSGHYWHNRATEDGSKIVQAMTTFPHLAVFEVNSPTVSGPQPKVEGATEWNWYLPVAINNDASLIMIQIEESEGFNWVHKIYKLEGGQYVLHRNIEDGVDNLWWEVYAYEFMNDDAHLLLPFSWDAFTSQQFDHVFRVYDIENDEFLPVPDAELSGFWVESSVVNKPTNRLFVFGWGNTSELLVYDTQTWQLINTVTVTGANYIPTMCIAEDKLYLGDRLGITIIEHATLDTLSELEISNDVPNLPDFTIGWDRISIDSRGEFATVDSWRDEKVISLSTGTVKELNERIDFSYWPYARFLDKPIKKITGTPTNIDPSSNAYALGSYTCGILGNGKLGGFAREIQQIGTQSNSDWHKIVSGDVASMGLKTDGTLWVSGSAWSGNLGDEGLQVEPTKMANGAYTVWQQLGQDTWVDIDISIYGVSLNWVSADETVSVGIKTDGSLWTWGGFRPESFFNNDPIYPYYTNSPTDLDEPLRMGVDNDWKACYASIGKIYAIKDDGTLWYCNSPIEDRRFDLVQFSPFSWKKVAATKSEGISMLFICGISEDGTLRFMRFNTANTSEAANISQQVGSDNDWSDISSAANGVFIAIKDNGTMWSFRQSNLTQNALYLFGRGDGITANDTPLQIGSDSDWVKVSAGLDYVLALKEDGSLWGWGRNRNNILGNAIPDEDITSVPVLIDDSRIYVDIQAGFTSTTVLTQWQNTLPQKTPPNEPQNFFPMGQPAYTYMTFGAITVTDEHGNVIWTADPLTDFNLTLFQVSGEWSSVPSIIYGNDEKLITVNGLDYSSSFSGSVPPTLLLDENGNIIFARRYA